jgi:hypothetical protein
VRRANRVVLLLPLVAGCSGVAQEGDVLPTKVEVDSPLVARFLGEAREQTERDLTHTITVRAFDDRPFRISDAGPSHLVASCDFDRGARPAHTLKLRIDPKRASHEHGPQVTIKIDVEDQPTVSLSIVVLPPGV